VRGRVGPVALEMQIIWKSPVEPPGHRRKDDYLRCILMYIDGPNQSPFPPLCEAQSRKGSDWVRDYSKWLP